MQLHAYNSTHQLQLPAHAAPPHNPHGCSVDWTTMGCCARESVATRWHNENEFRPRLARKSPCRICAQSDVSDVLMVAAAWLYKTRPARIGKCAYACTLYIIIIYFIYTIIYVRQRDGQLQILESAHAAQTQHFANDYAR